MFCVGPRRKERTRGYAPTIRKCGAGNKDRLSQAHLYSEHRRLGTRRVRCPRYRGQGIADGKDHRELNDCFSISMHIEKM